MRSDETSASISRMREVVGTMMRSSVKLGRWCGLAVVWIVLAGCSSGSGDDARAESVADARSPIEDPDGAGIPGQLLYIKDVGSAFLKHERTVAVWLPPGYSEASDRRYPVLYMHDGQNLFDPRTAYGGNTWGVAETITTLVDEGAMEPVIVVGAFNSPLRAYEYSPWHGAPAYARFLIEELKPMIDDRFRTLPDRENTVVMGSSMGGLLSYYLVSNHPDVFRGCGCVSTHFILSEAMVARYVKGGDADGDADETPYILNDIANGATVPDNVQYWFDYGTEGLDGSYEPTHVAVQAWLDEQALTSPEHFVVRKYDGADHNEGSWRARLADPMRYLFGTAPVN